MSFPHVPSEKKNFNMSSSEELREALNRRLKKIDSHASGGTHDSRSPSGVSPPAIPVIELLDRKDDSQENQTYRSGWPTTPPIPRPSMVPPPPPVFPTPVKSDVFPPKVCVVVGVEFLVNVTPPCSLTAAIFPMVSWVS